VNNSWFKGCGSDNQGVAIVGLLVRRRFYVLKLIYYNRIVNIVNIENIVQHYVK